MCDRHRLRFSRRLAAFRWGRRWGGPAGPACVCLKRYFAPFLQMHIDFPDVDSPDVADLGVLLVDLHVMHLEAQRASSSGHVGFDKETWTSHADIHLKHMVHVKRTRHVTDLWRTCQKPRLLKSVIAQHEKAVQFLCICRLKRIFVQHLKTIFFGNTDVRRCGMCRPP